MCSSQAARRRLSHENSDKGEVTTGSPHKYVAPFLCISRSSKWFYYIIVCFCFISVRQVPSLDGLLLALNTAALTPPTIAHISIKCFRDGPVCSTANIEPHCQPPLSDGLVVRATSEIPFFTRVFDLNQLLSCFATTSSIPPRLFVLIHCCKSSVRFISNSGSIEVAAIYYWIDHREYPAIYP